MKQERFFGDISQEREQRYLRTCARTRTTCSCNLCKAPKQEKARVRARASELPTRHQRVAAAAEFLGGLFRSVHGYDWDGDDDYEDDRWDCDCPECRSMRGTWECDENGAVQVTI